MKVLLTQSEIQTGIGELARRLSADYHGRHLTVLGVLTGSLIFLADLIRRVEIPLRVGLIQASSYRGRATSPAGLSVSLAGLPEITGRDVLLLDDIFDTGQTLATLMRAVGQHAPASLRSAVLLWKEGRQQVDIAPDYHCFRIPDLFVVGFGLDYNDEHRHLPYVAALTDGELGAPA